MLSSTRIDVQHGPVDQEMFCEWLDLDIEAESGGRHYGGESFTLAVCSVAWLGRELQNRRALWGRPYLIVRRWDYPLLLRVASDLCLNSQAEMWNDIVINLSRFVNVDTLDIPPGGERNIK